MRPTAWPSRFLEAGGNKMAKAKKKSSKKKSKKTSKTSSKKKKKMPKKAAGLVRVPEDEWEMVWNQRKTSCQFKHESGIGGKLGCGVTDHVHMYTDGYRVFVISINYGECYACVEVFDQKGCAAICFMDSGDCATIHKMEPDQIAAMLAAQL